MKILHIGLMVNPALNIGLSKELRLLGEYRELEVNEQLFEKLDQLDFDPDLIFIQIQNDKIGNRRTTDLNGALGQYRSKGAFIINWTGDKRHTLPTWMQIFTADITAFSNMDDAENFRGRPSAFLQIGIDERIFKHHDVPHSHDIVFMGNHNGNFPLSGYRKQITNKLKQHYGDRFGLYGNGWNNANGSLNADARNPDENQLREAKIYSGCKIALNVSHFDSNRYTSDRMFRSMGSGAFVLSHNYYGVDKDFEIGKHLGLFHNENDLITKIDLYLENERIRIVKSNRV